MLNLSTILQMYIVKYQNLHPTLDSLDTTVILALSHHSMDPTITMTQQCRISK